jgi:hypothetical protein
LANASEQEAAVQELRLVCSEASELIAVIRDWCLTGMAHYHECVRLGIRLEAALNRADAVREPETDAAKAKELLEQECRVTEEMLQRRVTL